MISTGKEEMAFDMGDFPDLLFGDEFEIALERFGTTADIDKVLGQMFGAM